MAAFTKVATASEIPMGSGKAVEVGGRTIALFNCEGTFYAIDNACKHRGGPLGDGMLDGATVTCPWHGWSFNVTSGACDMDPSDASLTVQRFEVKVDGDDILVAV